MSFFSILGTLLIGPLKLLFEFIFNYAFRFTDHLGLSIVCLSLTMNILVLPLYRRADAMQEEARDREARLQKGVSHIKKTFSGDERMMILQTYYRQNHYSPLQALNGSVSLLLEIPFFIAAYQFLSHLDILTGVPFGPIRDLGAPDGLLVIGSITINLLPILMTLINVVSSVIYLKGFPLKAKIQLYAMAAFFLVFLYSSPSCLLLYWTLNNVFSLVKNIFYKLKNPKKVLLCLCAAAGIFVAAFALFFYHTSQPLRKVFLVGMGLVLPMPLLLSCVCKAAHFKTKSVGLTSNRRFFLLGAVFLTVLVGVLIPSVYIAASPLEYIDISNFQNPMWYIVSSLCLAAGTFLIWFGVFYWLASEKAKPFFDIIVWLMCGVTIVNYMFFGTDLGIISSILQYEDGMTFTMQQQLVNLAVLAVVALIMLLIVWKRKRLAGAVLLIAVIALGGMSALNLVTISRSVAEADDASLRETAADRSPHFRLSTTGNNVVVIMLDRGIGAAVPYIFNEKPELQEQFSGFTYYDNAISFSFKTNLGTPPMFGGYEYTPVEMNRRDTESLASKHNEALKVMPVLFSENGFEVTLCDPTYAGYKWKPDLTVFDDCPGVSAYITLGRFGDTALKATSLQNNHRNFFCFGMMKCMPLVLQPSIYNLGQYHQISLELPTQVRSGLSRSSGIRTSFMDAYEVLVHLSDMTNITDERTNTYLFLSNDTTHEPMLLQEPEYIPSQDVNNTAYDAEHADRFVLDGREFKVKTEKQMIHYQANVAALMQLGNWFDYLRETGVYDNTRIILVSDHSYHLAQLEELLIMDEATGKDVDVEPFFPLFMVKDFHSDGFAVSDEFMTTADVPTLAMQDLISDPVNPFTGNPINSDEKYAHEQYISRSDLFDVSVNNGNTFLASTWASVHDNLWDPENWSFYDDSIVLSEHAAP